ncbi:hypothetical protein GC105_10435 [Alkalibaculum sp. M08DMB]|uniref:DUF1508 domain-containing protein n=1 Tax=Alkalibaculum sporogenes TaxID=2655001 RepID=A0A6A7K9Y3_9FIRM|nr:hypothetical protein [Alkalibaculum sporogenes]MPW26206.1 hypothetical protein [Alkalibaculum sporogenes]
MYTKYYVESADRKGNVWTVTNRNTYKIMGNFQSRELAIQFANELCKDVLNSMIIVNDKCTNSIYLDKM